MQTQLSNGDRIGEWVVVEPLGSGGMGSVYRCHSALTEQVKAALKVLTLSNVADAKARFVREIEVLASLDHPSIVRVLGGGQDANSGLLYLVMELVHGRDLTWYIEGRALPWADACRIARDVASGLAEAHGKGVHHRDIKPANIMLGDDGKVKLIDFGIALQSGQERLTRAQGIPGTMSYMPPEIFAQGSHNPALGDIYSLGVCLHEALVGLRAYPEQVDLTTVQRFAAVMGAKTRDPFLDPGDTFPTPVRELVKAATHGDPAQRIQDAASLAQALHDLIADQEQAGSFTPAPANARPKSTEETFTLDAPTAMPPAAVPSPTSAPAPAPGPSGAQTVMLAEPAAPVAKAPAPKAPRRGMFPVFSFGLNTLLAVGPPAWTVFCLFLIVLTPEGGALAFGVTLIFAPMVLPPVALAGFAVSLWFAVRVRTRSRLPVMWWFITLLLVGVHVWHLVLAVADGALIWVAFQQAFEEMNQPKWKDYINY